MAIFDGVWKDEFYDPFDKWAFPRRLPCGPNSAQQRRLARTKRDPYYHYVNTMHKVVAQWKAGLTAWQRALWKQIAGDRIMERGRDWGMFSKGNGFVAFDVYTFAEVWRLGDTEVTIPHGLWQEPLYMYLEAAESSTQMLQWRLYCDHLMTLDQQLAYCLYQIDPEQQTGEYPYQQTSMCDFIYTRNLLEGENLIWTRRAFPFSKLSKVWGYVRFRGGWTWRHETIESVTAN